jgi:hypothetical protein
MQNSARAPPSFFLWHFFSAERQPNVGRVDSSGDLATLNMCMMLGVRLPELPPVRARDLIAIDGDVGRIRWPA